MSILTKIGNTSKRIAEEFNERVPIGIIMPFAGNTIPNGWLLCDGSLLDRTTYANLFSVIGTTYGDGDGSTTFALPDLVNRFVEGDNTSGTYKSAGLPNITGEGCFTLWNDNNYSGAFNYRYNKWNDGFNIVTNRSSWNPIRITFNASYSNSIYGNSTTVQPASLTMKYLIKY